MMEQSAARRGRLVLNLSIACGLGILLGVGFALAFDSWLTGVIIGVVEALITFGYLNIRRGQRWPN